MFYLRDLRVKLQERRNRLYRNGYRTYPAELQYLLQFLDADPYTRSLLTILNERGIIYNPVQISVQDIASVSQLVIALPSMP